MFTGIIEEIGIVLEKRSTSEGQRLKIAAPRLCAGAIERAPALRVDDSISISGVCQTITALTEGGFYVDSVHTTLAKTTLETLRPNEQVHLETALTLQKPLGGHLVLGHVNGVGTVSSWNDQGNNRTLWIELPGKEKSELLRFIVSEGPIALDGVSLTIAAIDGECPWKFAISLIPHTLAKTLFRQKKIGDQINIEVDMMAKYAERLQLTTANTGQSSKISLSWLKQQGF